MQITINEQAYDLHFGMKALEIFYQTAGVVQADSMFQSEQITAIVWGGLHNGAYRQLKTLSLPFADVADWVEVQMLDGGAVLVDIMNAFNESQVVKKMAEKVAQEAGDEKKKRSTSKGLKPSPSVL